MREHTESSAEPVMTWLRSCSRMGILPGGGLAMNPLAGRLREELPCQRALKVIEGPDTCDATLQHLSTSIEAAMQNP